MDNIIASAEITVTDVKDGVGISSVVTHFLATPLKKGITTATSGWDTEPQTMDDTNKYLWSYETIIYTDGYSQDSTPVIIGVYGEEGVGISDIVEYYLVSSKDKGIEVTDSQFDVKIPIMDETNRYLWKYEEIIYTNNERKKTQPVIVGVFGSKGTSVKNIENYYLTTSASSGVTRNTDGFNTSMQPLTLTNKYLWNYEVIEYENPTSFSYTNPVIIGVHGEDGKDGVDAKLLYLTSTLETMTFDADGAATPSSQTSTIEAKLQNTSGSVSFTAKAYSGTSALSNSVPLGGSGNSRTFSVSSFPSNATHVSITATLGNLTDTVSIFKLRHGKEGAGGAPGQNAIVGYLTNESITLGASSSGRVGSFTPATGTFRMFDGTTEVTTSASTTYTLENSNGLVASINSSGVYSITAMSSGTATAEFKATYKDVSIFKTVTLSKSIAGEKGEPGAKGDSAISAVLTNESITFAADKDGIVQNYVGNTGAFLLMEGTVNKSAETRFEKVSETNVSATINTNGSYTIYPMTNGTSVTTGQVTFRATYKSTVIDKTVTISKSIAGQTGGKGDPGAPGGKGDPGAPGAPATSYWLTSSVDTITVKYNGDYDPKTITYYAHSKTGSNNTQSYAGRFIIQTSIDGINFKQAYLSQANENEVDFSVPKDVLFIKAKFYQVGGTTYLLDEQTTPILHSADGLKGIGLEDKDYQVGTEIFTDKADDSVVHVEVDGKSSRSDDSILTLDRLGNYAPYNTAPTYNANTNTITFTYLNTNSGSLIAVNNNVSFKGDRRYIISGYAHINGNPLDWPNRRLNTENPVANSHSFHINSQTGYFEADETYTTSWLLHTSIRGAKSGDIITIRDFKAVPVAPHPDMPKEIHSLNNVDVVSSVGRENILENSSFRDNTIGWSASRDVSKAKKDGYDCYVIEHDAFGATKTITQSIHGDVEAGKRYIISGWIYTENIRFGTTNPTRMFYIDGYDRDNNWIGLGSTNFPQNSNRWVHMSYVTPAVTERHTTGRTLVFFLHTRDITGKVYVRDVKMEAVNSVSDTYTAWTPSPRDITEDEDNPVIDKINLLLSEPLRSVGDVKDRLFRDDSDGLWKVERKIKELIFDGSEVFKWFYAPYFSTSDSTTDRNPVNSSHFSYSNGANALDGMVSWGGNPNSNGNMFFGKGEWIDLTVFVNWVKQQYQLGTPLISQYVLENPTLETLDQELQDKLNNLRSFQDSNYVYTVINDKTDIISENLKPQISCTFKGGGFYTRWKTAYDLEKTTDYIEQEIKRTQNTAWVRAGMRVGYSSFTQTNPNNVYICGLEYRDGYRDMVLVDKPAEIYVRDSEQTDVIPNQALSVSGIPAGTTTYIIWDNTKKELFFIYYESVMTSTGVSKKRWRNIAGQTIEFTDSLFAIGEVEV